MLPCTAMLVCKSTCRTYGCQACHFCSFYSLLGPNIKLIYNLINYYFLCKVIMEGLFIRD
jgi:hypothetical protein